MATFLSKASFIKMMWPPNQFGTIEFSPLVFGGHIPFDEGLFSKDSVATKQVWNYRVFTTGVLVATFLSKASFIKMMWPPNQSVTIKC